MSASGHKQQHNGSPSYSTQRPSSSLGHTRASVDVAEEPLKITPALTTDGETPEPRRTRNPRESVQRSAPHVGRSDCRQDKAQGSQRRGALSNSQPKLGCSSRVAGRWCSHPAEKIPIVQEFDRVHAEWTANLASRRKMERRARRGKEGGREGERREERRDTTPWHDPEGRLHLKCNAFASPIQCRYIAGGFPSQKSKFVDSDWR